NPVTELVTAHTGAGARPSFVRRVAELTHGNPLFVDEMMRMLVAEGRLSEVQASGALPLPHGVREVIQRRLEPLDPSVRRLLPIASVIGVEFDLETLAGVTGADYDELLDLFEQAADARVVHQSPEDLIRW